MIYADCNSSTRPSLKVRNFLKRRLAEDQFYANPNSLHSLGRKIGKKIEDCRQICAKALGAKPSQIIFNSGASEGVATIFHSLLNEGPQKGPDRILISNIEHPCVWNTAHYYKRKGYTLDYLPVDKNGVIQIDLLENYPKKNLALLSLMAANNETGVISPIFKIDLKTPFFSDTTQLISKKYFNFSESNLDYAVLSSHKVGGLIGQGILMVKNPKTINPLILGGHQEMGLRAGTQNYIGIEALSVALQEIEDAKANYLQIEKQRLNFEKKIKKLLPQVVILGEAAMRLPNTTTISFPGLQGDIIQLELDALNIQVTTHSACSEKDKSASRIIKAMGLSPQIERGIIRISMGNELSNIEKKYDTILNSLIKISSKLKKINCFIDQ